MSGKAVNSGITDELENLAVEAESEDLPQIDDFDPVQADVEQEESQASSQAAAAMVVSGFEMAVKLNWPYVEYDDATKSQAIEVLAPVCAKYGTDLPEWLKPYQEELKAGVFLGGVAYGTYLQIQAHNAQEANDDKPDEQGAESEGAGKSEPIQGE